MFFIPFCIQQLNSLFPCRFTVPRDTLALLPTPFWSFSSHTPTTFEFYPHSEHEQYVDVDNTMKDSHIPGESAPCWCQGGVWTLSGLRGTDPVPGSCLIIPLSIWELRVFGGDSECFLFLAGCTGRLRESTTKVDSEAEKRLTGKYYIPTFFMTITNRRQNVPVGAGDWYQPALSDFCTHVVMRYLSPKSLSKCVHDT